MDTDNFSLLTEKDTVKFVTGSLADCERAVEIMKQFRLIGRCHLISVRFLAVLIRRYCRIYERATIKWRQSPDSDA